VTMMKHVNTAKDNRARWREFDRGDLVQVRGEIACADGQVKFTPAGVVLEFFDSNVYESSSCSVLVDGRVLHVSTRQLTMIKEASK
jgi:hypothetical protein